MFPLIQHRNRTLHVDQARIADNFLARTNLIADQAAGVGTLTVKDIAAFAVGKFVWINPYGANSEIIAVHAATVPAGSTITLAANTAFAHASGEEILYIEFNQIEYNHAATVAGSKTVLATSGFIAREREGKYLDVSQTSGYYFARYKNSVATVYSDYSDALPYGGWSANTAGFMIDASMRELGLGFSEKVSITDCLRWIRKGLQDAKGKLKVWPEHFVYDYVAGQIIRGVNEIAMPADIHDGETNRSIESIRFGNREALRYVDPKEFDEYFDGVNRTDVRTQATAAAVTLAINNSYDFEDSGTVTVYVSGVKYDITYTGVTRSATVGVLTGIPAAGAGAITVTIPVGTVVWQGETESIPEVYTVRNGQIEFAPLASGDYDNENVYLDYNATTGTVNSESDAIDFHRFDMIESYLTWRIWCKAENDSKLDETNGYYREYKQYLNDTIRTLPTHKHKTGPNLNTMARRGFRRQIRPITNN